MVVLDLVLIRGRSMIPLLRPDQLVVVNRLAYGLRIPGIRGYLIRWADPSAGDVVLFISPSDGRRSVKWCVAGPGQPSPPSVPGRPAVPQDHVFVLGLNRGESLDSRHFGPIPVDQIVGKVLVLR
jgi:signal peptidase I